MAGRSSTATRRRATATTSLVTTAFRGPWHESGIAKPVMVARRALVIGGSLGGLFAAHLLRSVGWDAVVFERNPEDLTGRGAGLSTHPQLIDILRRLGIDFDESMGVSLDTFIFLDRTGKTYLEAKTVRTMSSWGRLYRALRDPLPSESYRLGMCLRNVEQDATGVTAVFTDGARVGADLLVGAHGARAISAGRCAQLCRIRRLAGDAGRERGPDRHPGGDFRALHFLSAGRRAVLGLPRSRPQQRDAGRPARLQHRLVPAD